MKGYSAFSLIRNALSGHRFWKPVWRTPTLSVFWWLLLAFGGGLLLGVLGVPVSRARQAIKHRRLSKELSASNQELSKLRNMNLHS